MITVHNISNYKENQAIVITIGTFDGVHIGHQKILDKIINHATHPELKSAVLTFFPHPRMVLQKDTDIKLLNTIDEKIAIFESLGLDILIIHPFTKEFSRLSSSDFVNDLLVDTLKTKKIIIGYDHRFGRNRNADITDLKDYGERLNFSVEEIPAQEIEEVSVSSTKIRIALLNGDIKTANAYLGYEYMLSGTVRKGKGLGRTLHFPTANIHIEEDYKLIPKNGAYTVKSILNNKVVYGMMNIGFNPTVSGTEKSIEVNFFDFDGDLYDKKIKVQLLGRLRDEKKFNSIDDLKIQLAKDKENSLRYILA